MQACQIFMLEGGVRVTDGVIHSVNFVTEFRGTLFWRWYTNCGLTVRHRDSLRTERFQIVPPRVGILVDATVTCLPCLGNEEPDDFEVPTKDVCPIPAA